MIRAEPLRKITQVGSVRVEAVSLDGGRSWVWPPDMAAKIHAAAKERREIFNVWTKKRKRSGAEWRKALNLVSKQESEIPDRKGE